MSYDLMTSVAFSVEIPLPIPEWSLYGAGHVIAATIVRDEPNVEARILFDGKVLYRSRHATRAAASAELVALRGQWARNGWIEAS